MVHRHALDLASPFSAPLWFVVETASTMDEARSLVGEGTPAGTLVMADRQLAGRGRLPGRTWFDSGGSSLLATLILESAKARLPGLTVRVGLALARACEKAFFGGGPPLRVGLKWPNDLMIGDRKLGGILCEAGPGALLVGFGINVGQKAFPGELADKAVSLAMALHSLGAEKSPRESPRNREPRLRLLESCLVEIAAVLEGGPWKEEAEARLWRLGEEVTIVPGRPGAEPPWRAVVEGLAEDGRLRVRDGAGRSESLLSAEISLR